MAMKYSEFGSVPSFRSVEPGGGAANTTEYRAFYPLHNAADPAVVTQAPNANATNQALINRQMGEYNLLRREQSGASIIVKMFIPFHFIFDCIGELPDDGAVFSGYGQRIKMNIRLNSASECLNCFGVNPTAPAGQAIVPGVPTYTLEKMQLVKVFSKLTQPLADNVLKSSLEFPLCRYVHWQQSITTPVINAIYSVSRDDLITSLIFGFHTNTQCGLTTEASNTAASITNAAAS